MPNLLLSITLLIAVEIFITDGSRTVTRFTPGSGCGITTEIKAVSGKGDKGGEEDQPCTLRTYLDESEISFHNEKGEEVSSSFLSCQIWA